MTLTCICGGAIVIKLALVLVLNGPYNRLAHISVDIIIGIYCTINLMLSSNMYSKSQGRKSANHFAPLCIRVRL